MAAIPSTQVLPMFTSRSRSNPLKDIECEVWMEGLEFMRRRLEEKLQACAEDLGAVSPPEPSPSGSCEPTAPEASDDGGRGGSSRRLRLGS